MRGSVAASFIFGVPFIYKQQAYKALIHVVLAPSIVANGLLESSHTKGDASSKTYGKHFGSKAGVLLTELPSIIFIHLPIHKSRV